MEEIKVYQNITKIGLEKQTDWQLTRVTRLPKSISDQVHFGFLGKLSVLKTQDIGQDIMQLLGIREGRERWTETFCD